MARSLRERDETYHSGTGRTNRPGRDGPKDREHLQLAFAPRGLGNLVLLRPKQIGQFDTQHLGDAAQPDEGQRGPAVLGALDGLRIDASQLGELFLGQAAVAPHLRKASAQGAEEGAMVGVVVHDVPSIAETGQAWNVGMDRGAGPE